MPASRSCGGSPPARAQRRRLPVLTSHNPLVRQIRLCTVEERKVTFCRICEAHCGMVATVEDGRVTQLRPDPDHPLSTGYACPKGIAMTDVQNDPDRVLHPLRRTASGEFERVTWQE